MPGSEGGDRVHNFFDQEKISRQHLQVVDGSRMVSSEFHWPGDQGRESTPLNFHSGQSASDPDRGKLDRQSSLVHSSPFLQSPQRPTFIASPHQLQQASLNGYVHDHQLLPAKNDVTDLMGMTRERNQHNPFSRELLNSGAQYRNLPEQHRDTRQEISESPINFDFLGRHQQMNSQQLGMLQSSPRQHSGLNERQLLQQKAMRRNLYDVRRQQQLQNQDFRQMNSVDNLSIGQQRPNDQSPSNNTSFQDGSNFAWMSQHGAGYPNRPQGAVSPVMQETSNGISFSTEQIAPSNIFGFPPQSADHSLYGFPIPNTGGLSSNHSHSMDKPMPSSQILSERIPVAANHFGALPVHVSAQDKELGSRFDPLKSNDHMNSLSQGGYPGTAMGNFSLGESQQRNPSMQFIGIQGASSSLMTSKENTLSQAVILQDAPPLDPTEEQFLFGSDDNIWDAFGKSSNSDLDEYKTFKSSEFQKPFPSMQSGSWSALMQSTLAETDSGDTGIQEEWSGLNLSGKPASASHEPLAFSSSEKKKTLVANGNLQFEPSLDVSHYLSLDKSKAMNPHSMQGIPLSSLSGSSNVNERFQYKSASHSNQNTSEGNRHLDHNNLMARSEHSHTHSKSVHHPAAALNLKGTSSLWTPQQGTSFNNTRNQANMSSRGTYLGSVHGDGSPARSTSDENIMHPRQDEQKRFMQEEIQKEKSAWTQYSYPNSPSSIGQINSNSCATTGSTMRSLHDNPYGSQNPPVSHISNHWKHVGSEVGRENRARSQHPPEARPHVLDSSFDQKNQASALVGYSKHEKYARLQHSSRWDNESGNMLRGTFISGQSYPNVAVGKHNDSDQVAGNSPGLRQYQHHSSGQGKNSSILRDEGKGSNSNADMNKLHRTSSVGIPMNHLANKTFQSSQNVVELLNKAGQSRENSAEASRNSSEQNVLSDKLAAESPDTSMSHLQRNQFLDSQTNGLHLGAPHQRLPTQFGGFSQAPSSIGLNSVQFEVHHLASQAGLHKLIEHSSAPISSGPPSFGNQFQIQQACEGFPDSYTEVPNQKNSSHPDVLTSRSYMKTSVIPPIKKDDHISPIRGSDSPGSDAPSTIFTSNSSSQEQHALSRSWKSGVLDETDLEFKAANVSEKDGFPIRGTSGYYVKSDAKPQNSYSLLHQLQDMRSSEIDPNNRDSKRKKVKSSCSDAQQSPSGYGQHHNSVSPIMTEKGISNLAVSRDSKLENFISVPSINQGRYLPFQHGSAPFGNTPTFGKNDTQNSHNGNPAVSTPLTKVSPQMAPIWFERYGSLNREQLVPASDVWKHSLSRPFEVGQTPENSSTSFQAQNHVHQLQAPSVANQVRGMKHCSAPDSVIEQVSSPQLRAPTSTSLVSVVPHKIETATLEIVPWHKEVTMHGLRYLPNISASELKWANATNRIPEKVVDEVEQADNRTVNCKRRLVLTTQLMQQLLDPSPASVMLSDAYMNYESVVYFTSRVSCGSAFSLSDSKNHHSNMTYKKVIEQGHNLLSKVENDFLVRASKLENSLSSLEKQTSIQDLRLEWQDVEKFSVINRFAKFHGRGQADGPAINSAISSQNHGPQRYVTALPSPTNLPDTVQCLSL